MTKNPGSTPAQPTRATRSFRLQVALGFGALVTTISVLLSFFGGEVLKERVRERAELSLNVITVNVARSLAGELFNGSIEVMRMSGLQALWANGLNSPDVVQMLALSQATTPYSSWVGVVDARGVVRAATGDILLGQNVAQRPWFGAGLAAQHVGDVHPAKLLAKVLPPSASGEPLRFVDFAAPLKVRGETVGVLGIHGSIDWLLALIDKLLPADAAQRRIEIFVFNKAGELIFGPGGKTAAYQAIGQKLPAMDQPAQRTGPANLPAISVLAWADGEDYLTSLLRVPAQSPVSDLGWQVAVREPVDLAFRDVRIATWQAMGIGLATALLASLLAWWIAGRMSHNLSSIARAAHDVESGKEGAEIPLLGDSQELQSLSSSLNRMTRRLVTANQEMEATVRQRTAELEAANQELGRLAESDPLTGLLNRRGFDAVFRPALAVAHRSGRPISLAMVDIDHFKRINDVFGHDAGDAVLTTVAHLLKQRLRDSDVIARFGGEEFVLLLPETDLAGATTLAQALVQAVANHQQDPYGSVTISIGVAEASGENNDLTELPLRADAALYRAKNQGRNRVCS